MEALRTGDVARLEGLAGSDRRVTRHLLGRLWDPDERLRGRAAAALAVSAAAWPDLGRETIRRLLWALNDESATNGRCGLVALGEIGARCPELIEPFLGPIASCARDDGLRVDLLRSLCRVATAAPRAVAPYLADLQQHIDRDSAEERELAAELWSLAGEHHEQD